MGRKNKIAFGELTDEAKEAARNRLLCALERCPWHQCASMQFISDAQEAGVMVSPRSIRFTKDGASFSAHRIDLPVVLERSGIGKQYLAVPGDYDLFCATATAEIRQIYPDSADARLLSVRVELEPFDNNDGGRAFSACNLAAGFLERYLKNLAVTLSFHLHGLLSAEHRRLESRSCLDSILEMMGKAFGKDGTWEETPDSPDEMDGDGI